jgi:DNA end-binding protein Ku
MQVVAMIHHEDGAYGVSFPDFPGCTTVADDLDTAVAKAGEVLAFHTEGLAQDGALPRPRNLRELQSDPDFREDAKGAVLVLVPYEPPTRSVRINITLEESLLARIDRSADAAAETRSGYLAKAARFRMGMMGNRIASKPKVDSAPEIEPSPRRSWWKGYLKLSLVSCPISLYPTTSAERVTFVRINRGTGNRLKSQLIDSETGEVVDKADIARGYEFGEKEFVVVEDEELAALQIESTHTIDIDTFVPRAQIDLRYLDQPYYVAPIDPVRLEAFAVIRDVMRYTDMVAIARVVLTGRERPIALEAFGKGLLAMTLRYPYEVLGEAEAFANIPDINLPSEMRDLAKHIVDSKATNFDPSTFQDHYEAALVGMLQRKLAGLPEAKSAPPTPPADNVINLMDALRRSSEKVQGLQAGEATTGQRSRPRKER